MSTDHRLETFRRIFYILKHCEFDVTKSDDIRICFIFLLSFFSSLFAFEPRFIEIHLFTHNDSLNREQNLKEGGNLWIPVLGSWTSPSSKQTEADLTTGVKVGIESNFAVTSGCKVDFGRSIGVVIIKVDIEEEGTMPIRSSIGSHNKGLHKVHPVFVTSHIDSIGVLVR